MSRLINFPWNRFLPLRRQLCQMSQTKLEAVPLVDIDAAGVFKYVLIKIVAENAAGIEVSKNVVRGYAECSWHSDIYDRTSSSVQSLGLDCECLGGGRIDHNPDVKLIKIYGYSQGYGKADHSETKRILLTQFPSYEFEISDDGY